MSRSHFIAVASLLSTAAVLHTVLLIFFCLDAPAADQTGLLVWWGCLAAIYAALTRFLRRDRSLRGVILLCAGGFLLQLGLTLVLGGSYPSPLCWGFGLILWGGMYFRCLALVRQPVPPEQLMLTFELTVAALFCCGFFVAAEVLAPHSLIHLGGAAVLALAALARQRSGSRRGQAASNPRQRGKGLLLLLPAALACVAAAAAALLTQGLGRWVARLWAWGKGALVRAGAAFEELMRFLVSLLPLEEDELVLELEEGAGGTVNFGGEGQGLQLNSDLFFYLMVGAFLLVGLFSVCYLLWKNGAQSRRIAALPAAEASRRTGGGWRELWRRLLRRIRFWLQYLRARNTPPGLLLWLERCCHRRPEESPRVFLARCGERFPACREDLEGLALWLEEYYFAPTPPDRALAVAELRRRIKKVRRTPGDGCPYEKGR